MTNNADAQRQIVEFLCQEFADPTQLESVRCQIAIQLGEIGDEAVIPTLMKAIQQDPDLSVRMLAVAALGKIYQKIEYKRERAISYLQETIVELQTQYPSTDIDRVIDVEFTVIQKRDPQQWQRIKDVMSVVFAGGVEAVKVLVPVAGIPIEVTKQLYEIWKRNKDS